MIGGCPAALGLLNLLRHELAVPAPGSHGHSCFAPWKVARGIGELMRHGLPGAPPAGALPPPPAGAPQGLYPGGAPGRDWPTGPALGGPDDPARARRLAWSVLLRRSFGEGVLDCPTCHGRMELVSAIQDPATAARILAHLGMFPWPRPRPPPPRPPHGARPAPQLELPSPDDRSRHAGVDPPSAFE